MARWSSKGLKDILGKWFGESLQQARILNIAALDVDFMDLFDVVLLKAC